MEPGVRTTIAEGGSLRLGYFLERVGVKFPSWPAVLYRGVDRAPWPPAPGERGQVAEKAGGPLSFAYDRWWNAKYDGILHGDRALAKELSRELSVAGIAHEVVYAEMLAVPSDWARFSRGQDWAREIEALVEKCLPTHAALGERPKALPFLGCDIASPEPYFFHSAIYQPGFDRFAPDLPTYVNENGLLQDIVQAAPLLEQANTHSVRPYAILGVWSDPA